MFLPRGCCVVPCIRDVPPVQDLSQAEIVFSKGLSLLLEELDHAMRRWDVVCGVVDELDDMVHTGRVVRQRAAVLCSVMVARFDWAVGLMYHLPQWEHREKCTQRCLHKVLAWGVCPHINNYAIGARRSSVLVGYGVLYNKALPSSYVDALLDGAFPWALWSRNGTYAWNGNENEDVGLVLQWQRWHARLRKRQWIQATIGLD